ncbi:MBL fold metallo-hydrolase [Aerococcaceae bacterium WGS1372]
MEQKTRLNFYGGLDTIGGNIISLEYDEYRIITDFGAVVGVDINELSYKRNSGALYLAKKLPQIDGVYQKDGLLDKTSNLSFELSNKETIVLISHLHLDHVGSLAHLHPDIKVYATERSVNFYHSLKEKSFLPDYPVNWQAVREGQTIQHGPFTINFHLSDHDTEGAASIFIEAPDMKVIYSGDLRLSGFHPERVMEWAIKAKAFEADILLLEGTSYSFKEDVEPSPLDKELNELMTHFESVTELGLMKEVNQEIKDSNQLIAFNGYPQNMERVLHLAEVFAKNQRLFVLQANMYQLIVENYGQVENISPLATADKQFGITLEQIKESPQNYAIQVDEYTYETLYELGEGTILHSNGVPLGSFMEGYEEYIRGLTDHSWQVINAGVSGHASKGDLLTLAYTINAKVTVPWHTRYPKDYSKALEAVGVTTWLPSYNQSYTLDTIVNIESEGTK